MVHCAHPSCEGKVRGKNGYIDKTSACWRKLDSLVAILWAYIKHGDREGHNLLRRDTVFLLQTGGIARQATKIRRWTGGERVDLQV